MNKYFNKKLYFQSILEVLKIAIVVFVVGIIILLAKSVYLYGDIISIFSSTMDYNILDISLFVAMILGSTAICIKAISFGWNSKKTDHIYSLPYTKGQIYITKLLAVVSMQFILLILITLVGILLSFKYLGKIVFISDLIILMIDMMIGSLIIIGAFFLSIGVTGKKTSTLLVASGILLSPALIFIIRFSTLYLTNTIIENFLIQKKDLYIIPNIFSTVLGNYNATRYLPSIIFSSVLSCIFIVLGYMLFKTRSGELSGNYTKNKAVHFITMGIFPFVIIFILAILLLSGDTITTSDIRILIGFFVIALLITFSYEIKVSKKIRRNNRCIWVYLVCCIISFAVVSPTFLVADKNVKRPISAEEVESINIITHDSYDFSYGEYSISSLDLKNDELINNTLKGNIDYSEQYDHSYRQEVRFNLKSGKTTYRLVPVFFEWENGIRKTNIDEMLEKESDDSDYIKALYTSLPEKYVTYIYDNNIIEIEDRQDDLKKIYTKLAEEYIILNTEKKDEIKKCNFCSRDMTYDNIYMNYDCSIKSNILPIGYLFIKGRVDDNNLIDKYKITNQTPEAANLYIQMINERNVESYKKFITDYNDSLTLEHHVLVSFYYYDELDEFKIESLNFRKNYSYNQQMAMRALDIIKNWELYTPKINDNFIAINYYYEDVYNCGTLFIGVTDEQLNQLIELSDEINGD